MAICYVYSRTPYSRIIKKWGSRLTKAQTSVASLEVIEDLKRQAYDEFRAISEREVNSKITIKNNLQEAINSYLEFGWGEFQKDYPQFFDEQEKVVRRVAPKSFKVAKDIKDFHKEILSNPGIRTEIELGFMRDFTENCILDLDVKSGNPLKNLEDINKTTLAHKLGLLKQIRSWQKNKAKKYTPKKYLIYDLETTDKDKGNRDITQIAWCVINSDGQLIDSNENAVDISNKTNDEINKIINDCFKSHYVQNYGLSCNTKFGVSQGYENFVTEEQRKTGVTINDALSNFLNVWKSCDYVVGHNIKNFDNLVLQEAINKTGNINDWNFAEKKFIDTYELALQSKSKVWKGNNKLSTIFSGFSDNFDIDKTWNNEIHGKDIFTTLKSVFNVNNAHNALTDIGMNACVFLGLNSLNKYSEFSNVNHFTNDFYYDYDFNDDESLEFEVNSYINTIDGYSAFQEIKESTLRELEFDHDFKKIKYTNSKIANLYWQLKYYDALMDAFTDGLFRVKNKYKYDGAEYADKYENTGVGVNIRTSWQTGEEHANAHEQMSKLPKLILKYLPQYQNDKRTKEVIDSSKAVKTFGYIHNFIESMLRSATNEEQFEKYYKCFTNPEDVNWESILTECIKYANNRSTDHLYLPILYAFKNHLFAKDFDWDFKSLYVAFINKTHSDNYLSTSLNRYDIKKGLQTKILTEYTTGTSKFRFPNETNAMIHLDSQELKKRDDINNLEDLLRAKGIEIVNNKWNLGNGVYLLIENSDGNGWKKKFEFRLLSNDSLANSELVNKIMDKFGFYLIPEAEVHCRETYNTSNATRLGLYLCGLANEFGLSVGSFLNKYKGKQSYNFSNYFFDLDSLSNAYNIIEGGTMKNTIKGEDGNNRPTQSLISQGTSKIIQIYDFNKREKQIFTDWNSGNVNAEFIASLSPEERAVYNLHFELVREHNIFCKFNGFAEGVYTSDCIKIHGKAKHPKAMSTGELIHREAMYYFLQGFSEGTNIMYMQPVCYSDKSSQSVDGFYSNTKILNGTHSVNDMVAQLFDRNFDGNIENTTFFDFLLATRGNQALVEEQNIVHRFNIIGKHAYGANWTLCYDLNGLNREFIKHNIKENQLKKWSNELGFNWIQNIFGNNYKIKQGDNLVSVFQINLARVRDTNLFRDAIINNDRTNLKNFVKNKFVEGLKDILNSKTSYNKFNEPYLASLINNTKTSIMSDWFNDFGDMIFAKIKKGDEYINITSLNTVSELEELIKEAENIQINPALLAYDMAKITIARDSADATNGSIYSHKGVRNVKGDQYHFAIDDNGEIIRDGIFNDTLETSIEEGENNEYVNYTKRQSISGSKVHSMLVNTKYGVDEKVTITMIEDLGGIASTLEHSFDVKVWDGASLSPALYFEQENNSLGDVQLELSARKTIYHDLDAATGCQKFIKHANYPITADWCRKSMNSDVKMEALLRQLLNHKECFSTGISDDTIRQINEYMRGRIIYAKDNYDVDSETYGKIYGQQITFSKKGNKIVANITKNYYTDTGAIDRNIPTIKEEGIVINRLYQLYRLLGGSYYGKFNNGVFEYTHEGNVKELNKIVCDFGWKSNFIAMASNVESVKAGVTNSNSSNSWKGANEDFSHQESYTNIGVTELDTKYQGVILNATHELEEEIETPQGTQMLMEICQKGNKSEYATYVYGLLKQYIKNQIYESQQALADPDKDELTNYIYKILIDELDTDSSAVSNMSNDFIRNAWMALNRKKFSYSGKDVKVAAPLSKRALKELFVNTINSATNTLAIRLKAPGYGGVMTPSYGFMIFYEIDTKNGRLPMMYDDLVKYVRSQGDLKGWSVSEVLNNSFKEINGVTEINPLLQKRVAQVSVNGRVEYENIFLDLQDTLVFKYFDKWYEHKFTSKKELQDFYECGIVKIEENGEKKYITITSNEYYINQFKPKNLRGYRSVVKSKEDPTKEKLLFNTNLGRLMSSLEVFNNDLKKVLFNEGISGVENIISNWEVQDEWRPRLVLDTIKSYYNESESEEIKDEATWKKFEKFVSRSVDKFIRTLKSEGRIRTLKMDYIRSKNRTKNKFKIDANDSLYDILSGGVKYFEDKLAKAYKVPQDCNGLCQGMILDKKGNSYLIQVCKDINEERKYFAQFGANNSIVSPTYHDDFINKDGQVYYKKKLLGDSDNIKFFELNLNSGPKNLIIVRSMDDLEKVLKTNFSNKFIVNTDCDASNENNANFLNTVLNRRYHTRFGVAKIKKKAHQQDKPAVQIIKEEQDQSNRRIAKMMYDSFKEQLFGIGTRIPSQSMQSFAALQCVGFVDSKFNETYVPIELTAIQGSDYDIDKIYITEFYVDDEGYIPKISKLSDIDGFEDIVTKLPLSERKSNISVSYEFREEMLEKREENSTEITLRLDEVWEVLKMSPLYRDYAFDHIKDLRTAFFNHNSGDLTVNQFDWFTDKEKHPEKVVKILTKIINQLGDNKNYIKFDVTNFGVFTDSVKNSIAGNKLLLKDLQKISKYLLQSMEEILEAHESSSVYEDDSYYSIVNNNTRMIIDIVSDPISLRSAEESVDKSMSDLKSLAPKGNVKQSTWNPYAQHIAQEINLMGKSSVGVAANGNKVYYTLLNHWQRHIDDLSDKENLKSFLETEFESWFDDLTFYSPLNQMPQILSNLNFNKLLSNTAISNLLDENISLALGGTLEKFLQRTFGTTQVTYKELFEVLDRVSNDSETTSILSALISAATDGT